MYGLLAKSCLTLTTPWTVAHQAPLSIAFSRQEYWRGLPFPSPGDLPDPGIEPRSPALQADSLPTELPGKPQCISVLISQFIPPLISPFAVYMFVLYTCVCFCFANRFICMRSFFFFMFYLLYFYFSVVQFVGLQDLSSLARDWIPAPLLGNKQS